MVVNAAAYRFLPLDNLKELRAELQQLCRQLELKGTILLAPEGLNLFVAGSEAGVQQLLTSLPLEAEHIKLSYSQTQPHTRMLVRLKKEIIAFGRPITHSAPRLAPQRLKQWLDEKRPLLLLDTRNDYEVRMGTFRGARHLNLTQFRDFPEAAAALHDCTEIPIVTFCTGGIRCEKAAPWLEDQGFREVWQLDGGILRYFEEVGGDHYEGECFVFDRRVGVDPALEETDSVVCPVCLAPLSSEQQSDSRYLRGKSCPHCFHQENELQHRQEALFRVSQPLPGSVPAENRVPLNIPARCQGMPLSEALEHLFPQVQDWSNLRDAKGEKVDWSRPVRAGERYLRVNQAQIEPAVCADIQILYLDEALLLIHKPAPLPMHPCGRFERNTLRHLLELAFAPEAPRPAHRLDANTSGLLVCARTHHFARLLQSQFALGRVRKHYLALVQGQPDSDEFEVDLPIGLQAEDAGLRKVGEGAQARTLFRVLQRNSDGTAYVEARPVTGRTHQIRVHLASQGYPIVGDAGGQTILPDQPPMHLHSWKIGLDHPLTGRPVDFQCPPKWERLTQFPLLGAGW